MKILLLALALVPTVSFAGTTSCVDERVTYSFNATDGGAPRAPIIHLTLDGNVVIHQEMFQEPVRNGVIRFEGNQKVLKKFKPNRQTEVTYFEQQASISIDNVDPVAYSGALLCKQVRYVGPPRP